MKWVTCVSGAILDVIIDIRPNSSTFGKYVAVELKGEENRALLIENGLGHAFMSLQENTAVAYLLTSPYSPNNEFEINPMDPEIGINWRLDLIGAIKTTMSLKDSVAPNLAERKDQNLLPNLNIQN